MSSDNRRPKSVRFSGSDTFSDSDSSRCQDRSKRPNSSILRRKDRSSSRESLGSEDSVFEPERPKPLKPEEKTDNRETTQKQDIAKPGEDKLKDKPSEVLIDIKQKSPSPAKSQDSNSLSGSLTPDSLVSENSQSENLRDFKNTDSGFFDNNSGTCFIDVINYKPLGLNRFSQSERFKHSNQFTTKARARPCDSNYYKTNYSNMDHSMSYRVDMGDSGKWTRFQEKQELADLNARFADYLRRVRDMKEGSALQMDSTSLVNAMKSLEDELMGIKSMYEREIANIRGQLEDANKGRSQLQIQADKQGRMIQDLQVKLSSEGDKNRKLTDDLNNCQRALAQKDLEMQQASFGVKGRMDEAVALQRELETLMRENETLKRRCDHEQQCRQEADEKIRALNQQLEFQLQLSGKQGKDMKDRLDVAASTILSLEGKIRELSVTDDSNLAGQLRRVREAAEEELRLYKEELEGEYNKNLAALKAQLDREVTHTEDCQKENVRLGGVIDDLNAAIAQLQGQISGLLHEKSAAEEALNLERQRAGDQQRNFQQKYNELKEMLITRMKEANAGRDDMVPLKAEIESLRVLLEAEEKKLGAPAAGQTGANYSYTSSYTPKPATTTYGTGTGFIGGTRYSAGATGYPPLTTNTNLVYPPPEYKPESALVEEKDPKPQPLTQAHHDMAKLRVLEQAVQDAAGQNEYPCDFRPAAIGPVRAKSAPVRARLPLVSISLGQGRDYFDEMFNDLKRTSLHDPTPEPQSPDQPQTTCIDRPQSSTSHDHTTATSSYTEDIRVLEVHPKGKFIRLENTNKDKEYEIGNCMIQQNVGGHTVAVFRFPKRTKFAPGSTMTIWSGTNDEVLHQPPTDFVFQEQQRWGSGPECTTILCKPNGQAISWMTASHRLTNDPFNEPASPVTGTYDDRDFNNRELLPELTPEPKQEHTYLRREKTEPASLLANKHPHGLNPGDQSHPSTGQPRPLWLGNDNSTFSRQSRSQKIKPDPIPGQPYAGASGQRMGSAPMRKYLSTNATVRGSGALANKSEIYLRCSAPPPSAFMKNSVKFNYGRNQIESMHDLHHQPPMPRPPLISQW